MLIESIDAIRREPIYDVADALHLATRSLYGLRLPDATGAQRIWQERAQQLLAAILLHVRYRDPQQRRLDPILRLIEQRADRRDDALRAMLRAPHDPYGRRAWIGMDGRPTATHPFVSLTLAQHLSRPSTEADTVITEIKAGLARLRDAA